MSIDPADRRLREVPPELEEVLRLGPFHTALAMAIAHSGLALSRLEYRLVQRNVHVGRSTLSYWQQGRRRPERPDSLQALTALEEILELPVDSLSNLLGPRKPRGRWIGHHVTGLQWSEMWGDSADIRRLVSIDSRRVADRLLDISVTEGMEIGADRRIESLRIDVVTQARELGADRRLFLYECDPGVDITQVELVDLHNCRIGRQRMLVEADFVANELLFDRALSVQETHLFGYRVDLSRANLSESEMAARGQVKTDATSSERLFRRPVHTYVVEAHFHPDMLPVRVYQIQAARGGANEQVVGELILNAHHSTHLALQNVQPGVHGIRWEWD